MTESESPVPTRPQGAGALAGLLLLALALGLAARFLVELSLRDLEAFPTGGGVWVGGLSFFGVVRPLAWLVGGVGGTAGLAFLLGAGHGRDPRLRAFGGFLALVAAALLANLFLGWPVGLFEATDDAPRRLDWPFPTQVVLGLLLTLVSGAWLALGRAPVSWGGEPRQVVRLAVVGAALLGAPTLYDRFDLYRPKNYRSFVIELETKQARIRLKNKNVLRIEFDRRGGRDVVRIDLGRKGADALERLTRMSIGEQMTVWVNGQVVMRPVIRDAITRGAFLIEDVAGRDEVLRIYVSLTGSRPPRSPSRSK